MDYTPNGLLAGLNSLMLYRDLLNDGVIGKFADLLKACAEGKSGSLLKEAYSGFFYSLLVHSVESGTVGFGSFSDYLVNRILFEDTTFGSMAERRGDPELPQTIMTALQTDLETLEAVSSITCGEIIKHCLEANDGVSAAGVIPEWENALTDNPVFTLGQPWKACAERLIDFYRSNGSGLFARYKGFVWERHGGKGYPRGLASFDPVRLSDFIGYELQRKMVVDNTLQFLNGHEANNMLLYGDRGTGKSSTVKALLNEYHKNGLRMIEMPKRFLADFHEVIRLVSGKPLKFIIFIDDLSFEDDEDTYTSLKAILEGGLENKPRNLLIYATTNRRHLIRERFSDRTGFSSENPSDEVHAADTMQEKLSLADRFGITVTFESPDQEKYLEIVEGLAQRRGLAVPRDTLRREAIRWEMWYNGRSPRTALQFVNWLEGQSRMS